MGSGLMLHDWILYAQDVAILRDAAILQDMQRMRVLDKSGGLEVDNICM